MKIFVTGANGQVGRSLQKIANGYPHHVFTFTDLPEGDIADSSAMAALLDAEKPGAIINCAAYTAVDRAENESAAAERANCLGPETLANLARERRIKLVHLSTDYVFDGTGHRPLREGDPTGPQGMYGATKLAGERAVQASGCDAAVIRTAWLYSEFGNNFVKTMLRLAEEGKPLRVVSDQMGSPTYAENLARAILQVIEHGIAGFNLYHYADSGAVSWYEFARMIFELTECNITVEPVATSDYPTLAHRPAYSVLDTAKIRGIGAAAPLWWRALQVCLKALEVNH